MHLQLIRPSLSKHSSVTPRLRIIQHHRLLKQLEPINLINRARRRVRTVKYDKRLSLCLQVAFRDDLDDVAIFRENLLQGFLELVDFDPFFQIADLVG